MGFLQKRLLRRLGPLGRIADIMLVGGAALRLAQRQGWVSDDQLDRAGLANWSATNPLSVPELLLAGGAVWRLLRRRSSTRIRIRSSE